MITRSSAAIQISCHFVNLFCGNDQMFNFEYLFKLLIHTKMMFQSMHKSLPALIQHEVVHYFSRFYRCFYSMSKEYFGEEEEDDDRKKLFCSRFRYYRDIAVLLYFTRIFFPAFIVHYIKNPWVIRVAAGIDPLVSIFSQNVRFFQPFMAVSLYLLVLSDYLIQQAFCRFEELKKRCIHSSSSANHIFWWRWWYELVVFNQDAYRQAVIRNSRLKVVYDRRQTFLMSKYPVFAKVVPEIVLKMLTRLLVLYRLENVDKSMLFDQRQHVRPAQSFAHLSVRVRTHILRYLFTADLVTFLGLMAVGKSFMS